MTDHIEIFSFADQADRQRHQALMARRLGLDPAQVSQLRFDIEPGRPAVATWEGRQSIPLADLQALIAPPPPENEECPTCTWPKRETVDMVCMTCGWDYLKGEKGATR